MDLRKIIAAAASLFLLCACGLNGAKTESTPQVTGMLDISVLKVGKADAIILRTQNHTAVIDCGEKDDSEKILEALDGSGKIDYLFITHFDKDHVGGAAGVLENLDVGEIITPDYEGGNREYSSYIEAVEAKDLMPIYLTETMSFLLDDVSFTVYPALKDSYDGDNNYSLAISVVHGQNKFLFAGDAQEERLAEIEKQIDSKYTFLKMPHHGVYEDALESFVKKVEPKYAVITCSEKNPPDDETIDLLEDMDCEIYTTADSSVNVTSDGTELKISTSDDESEDE